MFRYIIATGNAESTCDCDALRYIRHRAKCSLAGLRTALSKPGFFAACIDNEFSHDTAIPLHDDCGVVFGSMYRSTRSGGAGSLNPIQSLTKDQSTSIVRSQGRSLITDYWGHYVVAIHYPDRNSVRVMRSPVSPLACFHVQLGTLNVFFSNVADCMALELTSFSINWDSITAQVVGGDYLTSETALNEIRALECGEAIEYGEEGSSIQAYWDPRDILADRSDGDFRTSSRALRETTEYCVNAASSRHENVLVSLSGGLDSSIVVSALSRSPHRPTLTAVNYYSRGCGDERRFARSMAEAARCRLLEYPRNDQLDLRRFYDCNWTVQPVLNFSAPDVEARNIALARELGATAIFDGELGDNVFGSNPGPGALVECFRKHKLGKAFLASAVDYSMLTRNSLWRTLALARGELRSLSSYPDFSASREMLRRYQRRPLDPECSPRWKRENDITIPRLASSILG
jgi:asparagine synthase (glutamine-hydrolysing)